MIQPESIPLFTGDLSELERHIDALRVEGDGIRRAGAEAHRQFQGLSAFYEAPEAEELFASTAPVRDTADTYADKVATVVEALSAYAVEVGPIAKRLEALQRQAVGFVAGLKTDTGEFDENWTDDGDKVAEHQSLLHDINVAQEQFYAAEIACHNKITALVGGTQYVLGTGAKQFIPRGAELYGYTAAVLDQATELPWGTPVTQSHDWWDPSDLGYYAKSYLWDGLIVDGVWGTVDGLATLAGFHGSDAAAQSWEGIVRAVVGAETYLMESGGQPPTGVFASDFAQESKVYAKEFAKGFVAWDQWKENPARAAGMVTFNILTLGAGPLKAASAGKASTAAKVANTVGKVGEVIDPVGAAVKVTGHAIPKISELAAGLRGVDDMPDLSAPHSVLELSDGSKLVIEDGRFIAYDKHGDLVGEAPRQEPPVAEVAASARGHELSGVGATSRLPEAQGRGGDGASPQSAHDVGTTSGHAAGHGGGVDGRDGNFGDGGADGVSGGRGAGGSDGGPPASPHGSSPAGDGEPMARGGHTEQQVRDAIKGIPGKKRPKPNVMEKVLERLATEPNGQRIAEIIGSGRFNQSDEYGQVVSSLGANRSQMFQPGADQLIFADDLVKSGVPAHSIDFEQKYPPGADVDVRTVDESGAVYAYQLKHLNDPQDQVGEITRGKYLLQLAKSEADHRVLLVDGGRGTRADWISNGSYDALMDIHRGGRGPKGQGITFVIRLEDGTLVVPPGSKLDPKDML
ncbi:hypothetical protein OHT76_13095 [Streptomyces sp. NBC_00287]|uniref:hypothetical protein n=1 Tax=Streptomyces sp. NBC_00287 TaxID=2975702 RepID=UPI002E2958DA|nr:hypothetical protein [Streptomyces sp. NBC_00287]